MSDPVQSYRLPARLLHWGMALLILPMLIAGTVMVQDGLPRWFQNQLFVFHKNFGVVLLVLIVLRVLYRWRNPPPPEPSHLAAWQVKVAGATHGLLYALMVIMPLAGYVRVRAGGFPIEWLDAMGIPSLVPKSEALASFAKATHYYGSWAIGLLVVLHIAAALQHAVIKKDGVMSRMWPGSGR